MKKKLVSIVLALTVTMGSTYILAQDTSVKDEGTSTYERFENLKNELNGDTVTSTETVVEETASAEESEAVSSEETENREEAETPTAEEQEEQEVQEEQAAEETESKSAIDTTTTTTTKAEEKKTTNKIVLTVGSKKATINGSAYTMSSAPIIEKGTTYLPLRFIVDKVLEAEVEWHSKTQTATINRGSTEVSVTLGSKWAKVNGSGVNMNVMPISKNGVTYVPAKFICQTFKVQMQYNSKTKTITLISESLGPNHKPVASFYFNASSYTAGQTVKAYSSSTDPDGDKMIDAQWCVVTSKTVTADDLSKIFKTPDAGTYYVGLRVQDIRGAWSEWAYKEITILPNEKPVITSFSPKKESYAQGETIEFTYTYDNESWEDIVNLKWTYRGASEDVSKALLGKPDVFFTEGDYIITLQLDDAYGNRSEAVETIVHITSEIKESELQYRFTKGNIGDVIDNFKGFNYQDYKEAVINKTTYSAGTMYMSDSPEVVRREGILYRDVINGKGRILIHHVNGFNPLSMSGDNRRLVLMAENTSTEPVTITLTNKTIKGPVTDILNLGQKVLYDYLVGSPAETITLAPGERTFIYDSKGLKWLNGTCISGLMGVYTTGDVTFTTAAVTQGTTLAQMRDMELLERDQHPRGTFDTVAISYDMVLDSTQPTKLVIGRGEEDWVKGQDGITLEAVQNKGNFGISYYITITAKEDTGIILNPRATGFKGAIKWKGDGVYNIPSQGSFYKNTAKAAVLGVIKAGETKTFEYMLPNGSGCPVLIGFIPKSYWNE